MFKISFVDCFKFVEDFPETLACIIIEKNLAVENLKMILAMVDFWILNVVF